MNQATVSADADPSTNNNAASHFFVVSSLDLSVLKTGPSTANAGADVAYTITLASAPGSDTAADVTLTDATPPGTFFVSLIQNNGPAAVCNTPGAGGTGLIACTYNFFPGGASAEFTLVLNTAATTSFTNTATVATESFDTNSSNDSSSVTTSVTQSADVTVAKSGPAMATAGTDITYTVVVTNNGPSNAADVTMSDSVPAGTTFVSLAQSGPAFSCTTPGTGGTGPIDCSRALLAPGASTTFTIVVTSAPSSTGSITNTATATTTTADPSAPNTSTVITTVTQSADVAVTKTGPPAVNAGSNVTYTITVTNNGPSDASNVDLSDPLPPDTTLVSFAQTTGPTFTCAAPPAGGTGTITCSIATFASGGTATFSLTLAIDPAATGTLTNTATVSSTTPDPTPDNSTSAASAPVTPLSPDVRVEKTANDTTFPPGANATFTIVVTNDGAVTATGTTVTDPLPPGTTFVSATSTQGTCTGTTTVVCDVGTLTAGATATITLVVTLPLTEGPVSNTATATITNGDGNPANNADTATIAVAAVIPIPTLSPLALLLMAMAIAGVVLYVLRL
jgi:uncharacterized repeat protein (TIGR01451 family)